MKIRDLFDQCATGYDKDREKLVPGFDDLYGTALRVIPFSREKNIRVLDLGTGTGLLAAMIANAFPEADLHLTDISENMLAVARQRFGENPRITYAVMEHTRLSETAGYDLIVSALSIHHLPDPDKKRLFEKIHAALKAGGCFVNIDQALGPSPFREEQYEAIWVEDATANGVSESALAQAKERMREDKNALLSDQLNWLSGAGFSHVDCWYKRFRFVVYGGLKKGLS